MMKSGTTFGLPVLVLGSALGVSAFAQSSTTPTQTTNDQPAATSSSTMNPNDNTTYATGKPLQSQSKEGFWGHMNPVSPQEVGEPAGHPDQGSGERAGSAPGEERE